MASRVFVGGLTYKVRERDLEWFFRNYGRVRDVAMKSGFAFVEFEDYRDAEDAISELNGKELLGIRVSVERARGTPHGSDRWLVSGPGPQSHRSHSHDNRDNTYNHPRRTHYRLIVENLSSRVDWRELKDHMRPAGEVCYANAHSRRMNAGVVEFASLSHMRNAVRMFDNTELNGRRIHLLQDDKCKAKYSHSRSPRSRSRSQSRSRSRKRTRSRSESRSRDS